MHTKPAVLSIGLIFLSMSACAQGEQANSGASSNEKEAGGRCEDCEAVTEFGNSILTWTDTLPDFNEPGPRMEVSGTIYHHDGKTPAKDVILYIYHTDQTGNYSRKGGETGLGLKHGYIRGWIRTTTDGKYKFYTLKPAAYPGGGAPAHIHAIIDEPGYMPYWIDEYLFDGDPFLTTREIAQQSKRGGSGIITLAHDRNGTLIAHRNIILGKNIPGY